MNQRVVLALVSGALLPLAFAPFTFYLLAILSPALLFFLWQDQSARRCFWIGFAYGFASFLVGVSWVYVSLYTYGGMPPLLAGVLVVLFVGLLALFPAIAGLVQAWFRQPKSKCFSFFQLVLIMPVLWVGMEWVRGWILTGFPWLSLGYSQVGHLLANLAPWMGVYGVGLFVAIVAALLTSLFSYRQIMFRVSALLAIGGIALLSWVAGEIEWGTASGKPIQVALVQGNIGLTDKWNPAKRKFILETYLGLSDKLQDRDLIVWPEAALPTYIDQLPDGFWTKLRQHPADFVFGALERQFKADGQKIYNIAVGVGKSGAPQIYRKRHLVPFGEFLPFEFALKGLLRYLKIPMSNFSAWEDQQAPFNLAGYKMGLGICYEDSFQAEVTSSLPEASLLVNISEDAWFGDSFAPHQRLQMGQMRSLETARPMLRAANTGISAVIDHRGRVVKKTPQFQRLVLSAEVQPMQGATPFVMYGNSLILYLMGAVLALGALLLRLTNRGNGLRNL